MANPLHNPFCACLGGGAISLGPQALELDLLDFLEPRHAADPQVAALLQARRASPEGPFATWLRQAASQLPDPARDRLVADVNDVLSSIAEMSSRGGFACV